MQGAGLLQAASEQPRAQIAASEQPPGSNATVGTLSSVFDPRRLEHLARELRETASE